MSTTPIEWTDDLLTGDADIDNQHKAFFLKALRAYVSCNLHKGEQEIGEALLFMREYASVHFAREEALMSQVAYPYMSTHVDAHQSFIARLIKLEQEYGTATDRDAMAAKIVETAISWFRQHIKSVDMPFIETLKASARQR